MLIVLFPTAAVLGFTIIVFMRLERISVLYEIELSSLAERISESAEINTIG